MNDKTHAALAALNFAKERSTRTQEQKTKVTPAYLNRTNHQDGDTSQAPQSTPTQEAQHAPVKALRPQATADNLTIVKVDISIAGTSHRIHCPSHRTDSLKHHSEQINQSLRQLRGHFKGKSPSNEELLVLHCLGLYDQLADLTKQQQDQKLDNERACALADQLIKTTDGLLPWCLLRNRQTFVMFFVFMTKVC